LAQATAQLTYYFCQFSPKPAPRHRIISRPEIDIRNVLETLTPSRVFLEYEPRQKQDEVIVTSRSVVNSDPMMQRWEAVD
jgi:hypothetical protein